MGVDTAASVHHVCGLQGFGALGDMCPACEIDRLRRECDEANAELSRMYAKHPEDSCYDAMPKLRAQVEAAKELCRIYFEIAAETIGEAEVRRRRDAALESVLGRPGGEATASYMETPARSEASPQSRADTGDATRPICDVCGEYADDCKGHPKDERTRRLEAVVTAARERLRAYHPGASMDAKVNPSWQPLADAIANLDALEGENRES